MQVFVPPLAVLGLGWLFVLVEFGKTHTDFVRELRESHTTLYVIIFVAVTGRLTHMPSEIIELMPGGICSLVSYRDYFIFSL